jgi:hypothetical protein
LSVNDKFGLRERHVAFSLKQFAKARPYLYHLTATGNLVRIRALRCLESSEVLLNHIAQPTLLQQRRTNHLAITVGGVTVSLRDQAPLYEGNIEFEAGWTFPQVVALLNQRVFFWPGKAPGPIAYGVRYYERYEAEQPAVLRVPTCGLLRANASNPPLFCRYNSGSPRCSGGVRSPRGASTFQAASAVRYPPSEVVEVTFVDRVSLPDETGLRGTGWAEWEGLFPTGAVA